MPVVLKFHRNFEVAAHEVQMLKKCVTSDNVLRCLYHDKYSGFSRLALESYAITLTEFVGVDKDNAIVSLGPRALQEIASGVAFMHARGIVHLNLNPDNIVLRRGPRGSFRMLVTNVEHSRQLEKDETSFTVGTCWSIGPSTGWFAPELLEAIKHPAEQAGNETPTGCQPTPLTKAVDIFALGCIFFYVLTGGGHPFGDIDERDNNIHRKSICLERLRCMRAHDLITKMVCSIESERSVN